MWPAFIDHLWQSSAFAAVVGGLALVMRRNPAALRLWLWRIAALKFLLPFSLLFAVGGWLGFPVRHSAVPPPAVLTELVSAGMRLAAPAQSFESLRLWLVLPLTLIVAGFCVAVILRQLGHERRQREAEEARQAADWNYRATPPGFWQTSLLALAALSTLSLPLLAGATRDRLWRQQVLASDQEALRSASVVMRETPAGFGIRSRVIADDRGVSIRNINLQDLVSLVYGIGKFEVFGGALPWLEHPHYDVRVAGLLRAPEVFDPYSLRQPVTNYLYERFGVSIRVNGDCQDPCGDHQSFVVERVEWTLLK